MEAQAGLKSEDTKVTLHIPGKEPIETTAGEMKKAAARLKKKDTAKDVGGVAGTRLRSFIERIERLEEEKAGLGEDIKEVYAEAKGVGFDAPTIRKLVKERKMEPQARHEQYELFELYKSAIGMV